MAVFFFNDTATTEIYTLSLHDALPILSHGESVGGAQSRFQPGALLRARLADKDGRVHPGQTRSTPRSHKASPEPARSEEHTSELQSRQYLVCRLLLEKKTLYTRFRPVT